MNNKTKSFMSKNATNLLRISLSEMSDVIREHGEVVRNPVLLAEIDDYGQAYPWGRVSSAWWLGRRWPSDHRGSVHHLGYVLLTKYIFV